MERIVIIGNGIAGITAARHVRKQSDCEITVISGETDYFFSRTALMYIYMGHMKFDHTKPYEDWFWKKNEIILKRAWVQSIDTSLKTLKLEDGEEMLYDKLILALGSKPNRFGWPGQDLKGVSGLYSYQDLQYIEKHTADISNAVIVGGGLIGIELAEMLHSRKINVTFLVREDSFWNTVLPNAESTMINDEITKNGVDLRLSTELKEIVSDENSKVKSIITSSGEEIYAQFVGLTAGVSANIELVKNTSIEFNRGVLVDEYLETNVKDIYAIGDCAELRQTSEGRRSIEQVWYTGRMMGETLAHTISGNPTAYRPGIWFNSAKFFNIDYQTYGVVNARIQPGENHFVWQSEDGNKLFRLVFDESNHHIIGINVFGIRMRHEVWDHWIAEKVKVGNVMKQLEKANFDPEFFKKYESEIRNSFDQAYPHLETVSI